MTVCRKFKVSDVITCQQHEAIYTKRISRRKMDIVQVIFLSECKLSASVFNLT